MVQEEAAREKSVIIGCGFGGREGEEDDCGKEEKCADGDGGLNSF